jgi:predicted  nucleic acid-binding Zn-ribbon protein
LEQRRQTAAEKITSLERGHAELERQKQSVQSALDQMRAQRDSLQRTLEALAAQCEEAANKRAGLEDSAAQTETQARGARAELLQSQQQHDALLSEIAEAKERRAGLEAEISRLQAAQQAAAREAQTARAAVETQREKSSLELRALDERIAAARQEAALLERSTAALREDNAAAAKQRQEHETALADIVGQKSAADAELAQALKRAEDARRKAQTAQQDLTDLVEEARAAQSAAVSAAAQLAETQAALSELEAKRRETQEKQAQLLLLVADAEARLRALQTGPGPELPGIALAKTQSVGAGTGAPARELSGDGAEPPGPAEGAEDAAAGDLALARQDFAGAAAAYRIALEKNPYHAGASFRLACLLIDHFPDYATSEQLLRNAAALRPDHTPTQCLLAFMLAARDDVPAAVSQLLALPLSPESKAQAVEQFVERTEKQAQAGSVAWRYRLGLAYREVGRVEEALAVLQSIQREPDYAVLCLNAIGQCLRRQGLDAAAAKRFQRVIETPGCPDAQYHEALYNMGALYESKGDAQSLAAALAAYEELYAGDCTYKDVVDRIKAVKFKLGAADSPKVKLAPRGGEAAGDR